MIVIKCPNKPSFFLLGKEQPPGFRCLLGSFKVFFVCLFLKITVKILQRVNKTVRFFYLLSDVLKTECHRQNYEECTENHKLRSRKQFQPFLLNCFWEVSSGIIKYMFSVHLSLPTVKDNYSFFPPATSLIASPTFFFFFYQITIPSHLKESSLLQFKAISFWLVLTGMNN